MKQLLTGLRYVLAAAAVLAVALTLVSVVPRPIWWVQAAGFPRLQALAVLAVALVGLLLLRWPAHPRVRGALVLASALALAVQASFLWPFLPLAPKAVPDATPAQARDSTNRLRILVINVLIKNREDARLRRLVQALRPDVVLALEPDDWWAQALKPLHASYPYRVELPRADAYGLILYSRLPLAATQVQDLLQRGVPSVRTRLRLPSGREVDFFGIHPTPPIPDNYPDGVGLRGLALHKVATMVRGNARPTIVAGDFNDVSWSGTIAQLTQDGQLRDVNRGRGFYNTFDARSHLARWPLDHFFVSAPWRVVELKRLPDVGSDHFPLYVELALSAE
ncbi:endonuclease/exonuclease/phosphatase family protein [Hymenobacter nivis]|uniref:Endonuclease n=1 Tax=Hymenobacter nivis TaxID=1850093 RepID=A0A502HEG6_9BACT|nr:endonuclease/exonuclease/phosphatase family protein [Hymenobacter nivis]TPG72065.1 endonuclease [Hymenobacter nivis]